MERDTIRADYFSPDGSLQTCEVHPYMEGGKTFTELLDPDRAGGHRGYISHEAYDKVVDNFLSLRDDYKTILADEAALVVANVDLSPRDSAYYAALREANLPRTKCVFTIIDDHANKNRVSYATCLYDVGGTRLSNTKMTRVELSVCKGTKRSDAERFDLRNSDGPMTATRPVGAPASPSGSSLDP